MIKGTFKRNDSGRIVSFELTGHAQAGEYGKDIVCAAASALAISAVKWDRCFGWCNTNR